MRLLLCIALAWTAAVALSTSPNAYLRALCGFPVLNGAAGSPPTPTMLAQGLLATALNQPDLPVDGKWSNITTAALHAFLAQVGLPQSSLLGSAAWPKLVEAVAPLRRTHSKSNIVVAVQQALRVYQSAVRITDASGVWGNSTSAALQSFRRSHGLPRGTDGGHSIDVATLHLLASNCNGTLDTDAFWLDVGWNDNVMTTDTLRCLHGAGFRFVTFETYREYTGFWNASIANVNNAWAAGFESVGVYMFPVRAADPTAQVNDMLDQLAKHSVKFDSVMLDIEGSDWGKFSHAQNAAFISGLRAALEKRHQTVVVYCGREWPDFFGANFTAFSDLPVVYAHYDNMPSFVDFQPYGGWRQPAGKQFWDGASGEVLCGASLDWDWSPAPFWPTHRRK